MFRNLIFGSLAALILVSSSVTATSAATIASWTFETSVPMTAGPHAPEVGAGSATGVHSTGTTTHTSPSGNGSATSWNSNNWTVGDYYQFQVSTLGQSGITFAWDQTRSSSGPGFQNVTDPNFKLQYSTDGMNYVNHVNYVVPVVTWSSASTNLATQFSQDLSAITALDNQPTVYFRLTSILPRQASSTNGTSRVDNVTVTSIPEPASVVLAIACLVMTAGVRRII